MKKRIIIYGIGSQKGSLLNEIASQLSDRYEVIGYMDSFYQREYYQYKKVIKLSELQTVEFDYILIAVRDHNSSDEIYRILKMGGVDEDKIIPYDKYSCYATPDLPLIRQYNSIYILQQQKELPKFQGFLFGMSHACLGMDVNMLDAPVYNFAQRSLDIFYHKLYLEKILSIYNCDDLRFLLLEIPYYVFNNDMSKNTNGIFQSSFPYIEYMENWHHFDEEEENRKYIKGFHVYKDMFITNCLGNPSIVKKRTALCDETIKESYAQNYRPHAIVKYREDTVEENIKLFDTLLEIIHEKLPHVKLGILVYPQPGFVRKLYEQYPLQKDIFFGEMEKATQQYSNITLIDMYDLFAQHDEYFFDIHVNRTGCEIFSQYLNKHLKELGFYS